jgi:hypothetical protein
VILHAIGGLCNRLQAILSFRAVHGEVQVLWRRDPPVSNAHFLEVFVPIPGVEFVSCNAFDVEAFHVHKQAPEDWIRQYARLKPLPRLLDEIYEYGSAMHRCYAAMHIRRTDHTPLVIRDKQPVTSDIEFIRWAERQEIPVYLATDNGQTQRRMQEAIPDVVFRALPGSSMAAIHDTHRNGTLSDAVVDLFVCAGAERFKGTHYSSFSETIERMRALR